jgi:hypothetical protein
MGGVSFPFKSGRLTAVNNLPVDTPPFPLNTTFNYNSFTLFVNHLLDTLRDRGINDQDVTDIINRISTYANEITGDIGSAG